MDVLKPCPKCGTKEGLIYCPKCHSAKQDSLAGPVFRSTLTNNRTVRNGQ